MSPRGFAIDLFLLLMLDEERGAFRGGARLAYGLAAALLADLQQLGRVAISDDAVRVVDVARTGHAVLDEHLAELRAGPLCAPEVWIWLFARPALVERASERLVVAGTLESRPERVLGLFSVRRYRIVPAGLGGTLGGGVRDAIAGDAHAVPAELAAVAAILIAIGQQQILRPSDAGDAASRLLVRSDAVTRALARALARRAEPGPDTRVAALL